MSAWILWDSRIDKPFVRLLFETRAEALLHKAKVVNAYNEKRVDADVWPKEIPHPLDTEPRDPSEKEKG